MACDLLKVVIVDDEHLVRDLLKNCIDWSEMGCEISGEASCANEAIEIVDNIRPDIIFTDICMPYMDGIEFAKVVAEKYPLIKVVILTGYDEFEYAKRSIKVGISDFLLKPINDDEIKKVLVSLKKKIESERTHLAEYDRLKKQLEDNLPFLREKLLNEIIHNSLEPESINERLQYFHLDLKHDYSQAAVIDVAYVDPGAGEEDKLLLRLRCVEMINQFFREDHHVCVFLDNSRRIAILSTDNRVDLAECLEDAKAMLINRFKCFVCIGIGRPCSSLEKARNSYKEACNALEYRVIAGKNQVIGYTDIDLSTPKQFSIHEEMLGSLAFFLKAGLKTKAIELLEGIYSESFSGKNAGIGSIRAGASQIVSIVLNVMSELELNISEAFGEGVQLFDRLFKLDTLPEVLDYLKELIISSIRIIQNMQNKKVNQSIKQVQEYLQQNLSNSELSLSYTAKTFYMNISYLSRIFKQETGQTFVEYLTKARMEKAMKFLKETDLKAYQIAENVGIVDPHYFGICFKKYTGMSVNDFKKADEAS